MRHRITVRPKGVQYVAVSTVISPVTHSADVAVNRAVNRSVPPGPVDEKGNMSRQVPTTRAAAKPETMNRAVLPGVICVRCRK